jgi:hypothetical protein
MGGEVALPGRRQVGLGFDASSAEKVENLADLFGLFRRPFVAISDDDGAAGPHSSLNRAAFCLKSSGDAQLRRLRSDR